MRWVDLIVYGSLGLLGLATVWIIFRAVTGKGAWWALKGLLIVVLLVGLVFGGVYSWFHYMQMVPAHITPELVRDAHAPLLEAMRRLAGERDLEDLAVLESGETDWQDLQEEFRSFGQHPDLLLATISLRSGRSVPLYWQPGQKGGQVYLDPVEAHDGPPRLSRGIIGLGQWSLIHTFEYSEPAKDSSGKTVRLRLTLQPDGLERS